MVANREMVAILRPDRWQRVLYLKYGHNSDRVGWGISKVLKAMARSVLIL